MESSFKSIIERSKSILILLPESPDFDQVAAGLSLYLSLRDQRETMIVSSTPMTVEFNRLIGVNRISSEMGNKNLIIRFVDYRADDIERVSYDIENREFRLTVIPKPGVTAPHKDQVNLTYSGMAADTVLLIGGRNDSSFPSLSMKDFDGVNIVHIGLGEISLSKRRFVSFATASSSISEIVALLLEDVGANIDADIATNLIMGIEEGSEKFSSQGTSAETFSLFAGLLQRGGKRLGKIEVSGGSFPPGSIPGGMPVVQPGQVPTVDAGQAPVVNEVEETSQDAPKEWFNKPKIYKGGYRPGPTKGTSLS